MVTKSLLCKGHLIDSGLLSRILGIILDEGADYEITHFNIGKVPDQESSLQLMLKAEDNNLLETVARKLTALGVQVEGESEAVWVEVIRDKAAPEDFYSTTNHRTEVYTGGQWVEVKKQRMDASIVLRENGLECVKLRELIRGDYVLTGSDSVRVHPPEIKGASDSFSFMANDVSSERNATQSAEKIAAQMQEIRSNGGKIVAVAGPVVVHTGGTDALATLVRKGWINAFLGGNAIAVHDLESQLYGTSLGVDLVTGQPTHEGHKHHMMAINKVYSYGSIRKMMDAGVLTSGLMYELLQTSIPFCLAGSIRDDGPLPETEMDMIKAQNAYAEIISGADMIMMLSTMLHSIGTGNMTPSWVKTVCIDINPAVVTKLADRGSNHTVGVVSDVGLFLRTLVSCLRTQVN